MRCEQQRARWEQRLTWRRSSPDAGSASGPGWGIGRTERPGKRGWCEVDGSPPWAVVTAGRRKFRIVVVVVVMFGSVGDGECEGVLWWSVVGVRRSDRGQ